MVTTAGHCQFDIPIALILFNRPDLTIRVFKVISQFRPSRLFLIADGPRPDFPDDVAKVAAAREIVKHVEWDCQVERNFSDINLGVGQRVSSGIDWVFSQVEEAIILEDDCLPDPTFFPFCEQLLERYRDNERIMMISGTNHLLQWKSDAQSYHFSHYGSIWGWASWRRAWRHYDFNILSFDQPEIRSKVAGLLADPEQFAYRVKVCGQVRNKEVDTWDYQWNWSRLAQGGLSVISAVNLISNIGFGAAATHTIHRNLINANLYRYRAAFPLRGPGIMGAHPEYDRKCFLRWTGQPDLESIIRQGVELLNTERNIHALIFFEQASRTKPDVPELMYCQALALSRLGQTKKAAEMLTQLLQILPEHEQSITLYNSLTGK